MAASRSLGKRGRHILYSELRFCCFTILLLLQRQECLQLEEVLLFITFFFAGLDH